MKNCLTFSIKYKIKHPDAKIKFNCPTIFELFKPPYNVKLKILYFKYVIKNCKNILHISYPHFYIEHNEFVYDYFSMLIKKKKKIKVEKGLIVPCSAGP